MAARNPSSFDLTIDQSLVRPRKQTLVTVPDATLDNQERLVDMPRVVMLDLWAVTSAQSDAAFTRLAGTYYPRGRDIMETGTITDARGYVLCKSTNATNYFVRITIGGTDYTLTVSSSHTTWAWRSISTAITLLSDEQEETVEVTGRVVSIGNQVLAAGVLLTTV